MYPLDPHRRIAMKFTIYLLILASLLACSINIKDDDHAGAVTAGNTGTIAGIITIPDTPNIVALKKELMEQKSAKVLLYAQDDSIPLDSTYADTAGRYGFSKIDTGYYSLRAVLQTGQGYHVDSIHVIAEKITRCDFSFGAIPPAGSSFLYEGPVFQAGQSTHQILSLPGVEGGYWYSYDDRDSGGNSFIEPENSESFLDTVHSGNGAIRASLHLRPGEPYPWAGIGFSWAGGNTVDLSYTNGLCVVYKSNNTLWLSLTLTQSVDSNTYGTDLPASDEFVAFSIAWADMTWNYDSQETITIAEALQRAESINFQAIGTLSANTLDTDVEIQSVWLGIGTCKAD